MNLDNGTLFSVGVSMSIIGLGITLRKILARFNISSRPANRIAATLEGGLLCLFWGVPFDAVESYTGKLDTTPDIFVLGGVAQIGSAVWLVMNNSEILLGISNRTLGRLSGLQATFKTAIAYPVAATFRTGLTVSMFGLVIFSLMIMAFGQIIFCLEIFSKKIHHIFLKYHLSVLMMVTSISITIW